MKNEYKKNSEAEFDEASDIAIKMRVLAGEIYNTKSHIEWLKRQMFASTATGIYLDYIAEQRGLERKKATKARGRVRFTIAEPLGDDFVIPKDSVIATTDEIPLMFYTVESAIIPIGSTTTTVDAEAELAGFGGNVLKGEADVPINVPSGVIAAVNSMPFTGGSDEESDSSLRQRILDSFKKRPNGVNSAFYEQEMLNIDGIYKAHAVPEVTGVGSLFVYISGEGNTLSNKLLNDAQRRLDDIQETNVNAQAVHCFYYDYDLNVTVTAKPGYEAAEVKKLCENAFVDYVNSIDIGGKLYLSTLGKRLLETDCIETYEFDEYMENKALSGSQCFNPGLIKIKVV